MYKVDRSRIKIALFAELHKDGVPCATAIECALDCVNAGKVPEFWRDQLGDDYSDGINEDLERLKND